MLKIFFHKIWCVYFQLSVFKSMNKTLCLHRTKPVRPWRCLMSSWRVKCPSSSLMLLTLSASAWRWELNVWTLALLPLFVFGISFWFMHWQIMFIWGLEGSYMRTSNSVCSICLCQVGSDTALSDSLRVKALSCVAFLIKLKSKVKSHIRYYNAWLHASKRFKHCFSG